MADPVGRALEFASTVAKFNGDSADLQAKIIPLLLQKSKWLFQKLITFILDKLLLALKSLICLSERHPSSPKLIPAKVRFFLSWLGLTEEERKKAIPDERLYKKACEEVSALGCPSSKDGLEKLAEELLAQAKAKKCVEALNEYIKLRMKVLPKTSETGAKFEEAALEVLIGDSKRHHHVPAVENLYRRVLKSGASGQSFKAKGKELLKYSATFE